MRTFDINRRRKAFILLTLYLMILAASVLHVHDHEQEKQTVCQDCISHVHHGEHISQGTLMDIGCALCAFLHSYYFAPQVLMLSAAVLVVVVCTVRQKQNVVCRTVSLPPLRAPPFLY